MGRQIKSTSIDWGRNPDVFVPDDRANVRCSKCGFICNTTRETRSEEGSRVGYGVDFVNVGTPTDDIIKTDSHFLTDGFKSIVDPQVVGGCPLCGSMLYNK